MSNDNNNRKFYTYKKRHGFWYNHLTGTYDSPSNYSKKAMPAMSETIVPKKTNR
jgi:hypothetical protein